MPGRIDFRPAIAGDAASVSELTRQAYAKWVAVIGREPLPMTFDYETIIGVRRVELAFVEGKLAGVADFAVEAEWFLIENLAVSPAFQGQGIGAALLARIEAMARMAQVSEIRLYTNAKFAENIRFYGCRGYKVMREEPFRGGLITHMAKIIATR